MRIYTNKKLYKPGEVITSVLKKEERNINSVVVISANAFEIKRIIRHKKKKKLGKLVIQKLILLRTCVIILWNMDNY